MKDEGWIIIDKSKNIKKSKPKQDSDLPNKTNIQTEQT